MKDLPISNMPDDTIHKRDSYLNQLQLIAIATAFIMGITIQVGLTIFPPIALSVLVASALTTSGYMMYKFYRQNNNVTPKIALRVGMIAFAILLASGAMLGNVISWFATQKNCYRPVTHPMCCR